MGEGLTSLPHFGDKMLFVTHIPKCAGTTLRKWLWERVPEDRRYVIKDDIPADRKRFFKMPQKEKGQIDLVFGHICFGWHKYYDGNSQYITVLRDPVTRLVSLYNYIIRGKKHYLHDYVRNMSISEFINSGITQTVDNGMVRQLCGEDAFLRDPWDDMIIPWRGVTDEHLEMAIENLNKYYAAVGVVEDFDSFMKRIASLFAVRDLDYGWANKSKSGNYAVDPNDIYESVRYDQELYDYVVRKYT